MKKLISLNSKFTKLTVREIVDLATEYHIDGFELAFEYGKIPEEWFKELVKLCYENKMVLQFHGNSEIPIEEQIDLCSYVFDVLYEYQMKPVFVEHPIVKENKNDAIKETIDYMDDLINIFPGIVFSLENLNNIGKFKNRLIFDDVIEIVQKYHWNMTYDIGHEISDNTKSISTISLKNINNVHIHSFTGNDLEKVDHQPIFENDEHLPELLEKIRFLKNGGYDGTVVFEFDLYNGGNKNDTLLQKYTSYILAVNSFWQNI